MTELTKEQAISVLVQAAKIAQSKGAFTLEDASIVATAIKTIMPENTTANTEVNTEANTTETVTGTENVHTAEATI